MDLILDIKIYIASFDRKTWLKIYIIDKEFTIFASSKIGINKYIDTFTPTHINLPNKYKNIMRELLPPKPEPGVSGRPFWHSTESFVVYYKNNQFLVRNTNNKNRVLEVGEKGYRCVGCSPGSGPQPIIIASINHEEGIIGLIYPFVYKLEIQENDDEFVDLKVGKDMSEGYDLDSYLYEHEHNLDPNYFNTPDKYKVVYHKHKDIINRTYCLDVGNFGNYSLPSLYGNIPYEYI